MLGFFPIQKATAIVLAVMMGVAVFGVYDALNDSYQGQVTDVNRILGDLGPTTIEITGDRDEARDQMEAAIVWNAMAASDCRVLMGAHTISNMKVGEQSISDGGSLNTGDKPPQYKKLRGWVSEGFGKPQVIDDGAENAYIGSFESFMPLINNGFTKKCIGQASVLKKLRDAGKSATASIIGDIGSLGGKIVAVSSSGAFLVGCGATAGPLCVGGAIAAGVMVDGAYSTAGNLAEDLAEKTLISGDIGSEPGFDMEGRYGKLNFIANQSFTIGEGGHDKPLFGFSLNIKNHDDTPGFWQGRRLMYAVPEGLEPDDRKDEDHVLSRISRGNMLPNGDFGDRSIKEKFYAWRVRMIDVPIVADHELSEVNLEEGCSGNQCTQNAKYLQNFLDETSFLFCEGAEGYIQSNAKKIDATGEVGGETSKKEDQVYPFVEIEENGESCLSGGQGNSVSVPGNSGVSIVSGNIIDDLAATSPEINSNNDVVEVTDSKIEFKGYTTGESSITPLFIWQELPKGEKKVKISFDVKSRGQLLFELHREATTPPTGLDDATSRLALTKQDIPVRDNYELEITGTGDEIKWIISHPDDGVRRSKESEGEFEKLIMTANSDLKATIKSIVVKAENTNSGSQTGDLSGYDINLGDYTCGEQNEIGNSETIFSINKADGGTFETSVICGGIEDTVNLPTYDGGDAKELEYWRPQSYLRGCSTIDMDVSDRGEIFDNEEGNLDSKTGWKLGSFGDSIEMQGKPKFIYDTPNTQNKTVMVTLETENGDDIRIVVASNNTEDGKKYYVKDLRYDASYTETMSGVSQTEIEFVDATVSRQKSEGGNIERIGSSSVTEIRINGEKIAETGRIDDVVDMNIETLTLNDYKQGTESRYEVEVDEEEKRILEENSKIGNTQDRLNLKSVIISAKPTVCDVIS